MDTLCLEKTAYGNPLMRNRVSQVIDTHGPLLTLLKGALITLANARLGRVCNCFDHPVSNQPVLEAG